MAIIGVLCILIAHEVNFILIFSNSAGNIYDFENLYDASGKRLKQRAHPMLGA